jgi:hypothetical protein
MMWRLANNIEPAGGSFPEADIPGQWKVSWELHRGSTRVATAGVDLQSQFCMLPAAGTTWIPNSASAAEIADAGAKLFLMLGVPTWSRDSVPDQHSVSAFMAERLADAELHGTTAFARR